MGKERELYQEEVRKWSRREVPARGVTRDARASIRALDSEDERARDNHALFYDQSGQLIPGIDGFSANFQWPGNSGYIPTLVL